MEYIFNRRFAMAHRLTSDASPKCKTIHGHNETVTVTVLPIIDTSIGQLQAKDGMLVEFGSIKKRWHDWIDHYVDHGLQLSHEDQFYKGLGHYRAEWRLLVFPCDPTTEVLASAFIRKLNAFINADERLTSKFHCARVEVEETPTNKVAVSMANSALFLPTAGWWDLPSMATT